MAIQNATLLRNISNKGRVATLIEKPRLPFICSECSQPLPAGDPHYSVTIGGGGLGSVKFPERVHVDCIYQHLGF